MNKKKSRYKSDFYVERILERDRLILSRAITVIESTHPEDESLASEILNKIMPYTGKSRRIGLTGSPGVGKSTFIESFGKEAISSGNKLAVLTIDPSSLQSKGSILGDKTRMNDLSKDDRVFIRPSAAGQNLGGVSAKTREAMLLCEAAGFNIIIIETVGVGQSETLVKGMVDFFLLLMLPGGGDELQGIKRGIMELADMILITKADGDNMEKAKRTKQDYKNALSVLKSKNSTLPPVMTCSAIDGHNIREAWEKIILFLQAKEASGFLKQNRIQQNLDWMHEIIRSKIKDSFYSNPSIKNLLPQVEGNILDEKTDATYAANYLLTHFWNSHIKK